MLGHCDVSKFKICVLSNEKRELTNTLHSNLIFKMTDLFKPIYYTSELKMRAKCKRGVTQSTILKSYSKNSFSPTLAKDDGSLK